jgi:hypothetical protein
MFLFLSRQAHVSSLLDFIAPNVEELHGDEEEDVECTEADQYLVSGIV